MSCHEHDISIYSNLTDYSLVFQHARDTHRIVPQSQQSNVEWAVSVLLVLSAVISLRVD